MCVGNEVLGVKLIFWWYEIYLLLGLFVGDVFIMGLIVGDIVCLNVRGIYLNCWWLIVFYIVLLLILVIKLICKD